MPEASTTPHHPLHRLRVARERLRFSFRALDNVTTVNYSRLQRIEAGIATPSTYERQLIAAALHTPVAELFED